MLKQRVITAIVLAVIFILLDFFSPRYIFALGAGLFFIVGAWEWTNLAGFQTKSTRIVLSALVVVISVIAAWQTDWFRDRDLFLNVLLVACAWWALAMLWLQTYPASAALWHPKFVRMTMGIFVLVPAWMSLVYLRHQDMGASMILLLVFIVAAADIGAYFSGRAFGRIKLAPEISPGKTWEGVLGGVVFAALFGVVFNLVLGGEQWLKVVIVVVPAVLVSVVGDLVESMVKRHRGVKNSSQILPGHGGVLDRIDALVAAAPVFTLATMLSGWQL